MAPADRPLTQSARITAVEARIEALAAELAALAKADVDARRRAQETHDMVKALSDALLKPQPGHEKALLDRVAAVTIRVERGEWSLRVLGWGAGLVVALGGAAAAITKWGGGS